MSAPTAVTHVLSSEFSDLSVQLDPGTGAPVRLFRSGNPDRGISLKSSVHIIAGGTEHRSATGGLEYHDTTEVDLATSGATQVADTISPTARCYLIRVPTTSDDWAVTWRYEFGDTHPQLAIALDVHSLRTHAIARNVHLNIAADLPDPAGWQVHAPGNQIRPALPWSSLVRTTGISPAGGLRGSTGLIAASQPDCGRTLVVWPLSRTEIGDIVLAPTPTGVEVRWHSDVAGEPGTVAPLSVSALHLDLLDRTYPEVLAEVPRWLAALGITTPAAAPAWAERANIYEVQIGFSCFAGGFRYAPYPAAEDLLHDLERIHSLGYNTLQIMPRQPYPSYNVHDYADISTSYGDQTVLTTLVEKAHALGMHVILDILLHGVIDGEAMQEAIQGIHDGPFADRLAEETPDSFSLDLSASDSYLISWSRHLLDFEPYWVGGSPRHHWLIDQHPEFFCRNSAGRITGVYTKAFDVAHPAWQRYFIEACLHLMRTLGIDGFRFDAPTYNYFHNWSARTRSNAGVSLLGCLPLFARLRAEMKALDPDSLLYTEPSGVLLRQAMDVNYNYDEQWLLTAVMAAGRDDPHWVRNADDLGRWLAERDAALPTGSITAHHIDSHDTFWWPLPGAKWRREQFGLPATAAWMTLFALSGGPYMTFVGGEVGIEAEVSRVNTLRVDRPVFVSGRSDYSCVDAGDPRLYAVVRRKPGDAGLLLVNLSDDTVTSRCSLSTGAELSGAGDRVVDDLLGGPKITWHGTGSGWEATLRLQPFQTIALDARQLR